MSDPDPCPFCDGKAEREHPDWACYAAYVRCTKCGASGPVYYHTDYTRPGEAMRLAVRAWQRRAR